MTTLLDGGLDASLPFAIAAAAIRPGSKLASANNFCLLGYRRKYQMEPDGTLRIQRCRSRERDTRFSVGLPNGRLEMEWLAFGIPILILLVALLYAATRTGWLTLSEKLKLDANTEAAQRRDNPQKREAARDSRARETTI